MNFLRNLFGDGDSTPKPPADDGIYLYIKSHKNGEVIRLRLEPRHELVATDTGGYVSRKTVIGIFDFTPMPAAFYFDSNYRLVKADIQGGELTTADQWDPNPKRPE